MPSASTRNPWSSSYDAEHGGRPAPTPAAPLFEAERIRSEPRRPNWTAAMVAAIVAVIGFVGFTALQRRRRRATKPPGRGGTARQARPAPRAKPRPPPSPPTPKPEPSDSAIAAAPPDKVTVKLTAERRTRAGSPPRTTTAGCSSTGCCTKGESKTFQDKERIDLVLGNAGAIELFVNGKEVEDRFEPGQVERLTYTKGDPEAG